MKKRVWNIYYEDGREHKGIETHTRLKEVMAFNRANKKRKVKSITCETVEYLPIY